MTPGGEHATAPVANALVAFDDGAYLELVGLRAPALARLLRTLRRLRLLRLVTFRRRPFERRFIHRIAAGWGLADFARAPARLGETVERASTGSRRAIPSRADASDRMDRSSAGSPRCPTRPTSHSCAPT